VESRNARRAGLGLYVTTPFQGLHPGYEIRAPTPFFCSSFQWNISMFLIPDFMPNSLSIPRFESKWLVRAESRALLLKAASSVYSKTFVHFKLGYLLLYYFSARLLATYYIREENISRILCVSSWII
jgi:hypothetical protein